MSESMRRIYVEKKKEYAVEAAGLLADLVGTLGMTQLTGLRIVNRYDIAGCPMRTMKLLNGLSCLNRR